MKIGRLVVGGVRWELNALAQETENVSLELCVEAFRDFGGRATLGHRKRLVGLGTWHRM